MMSRYFRAGFGGWLTAMATVSVLVAPIAHGQVGDTSSADQIPDRILATLIARFPQAQIRQWTKEEEDGVVLYDIEFEQDGRKLEADIREDGSIHNWEREIGADDLPDVVQSVVRDRYPGSTMKEIMAITAVTEGTEALEGYEIVLETADRGEVEVTVAPDGTILEEETGEEKG